MKRWLLLPVVAAAACASEGSEGITVAVTVASQTLPTSVTTSGGTANLAPSYIVVESFALETCPSVARELWRLVDPLPAAYAHGEDSPTTLATPTVIAIAGERPAIAVGVIEPPPDRYCGIAISIGPADDDALRLPDSDMVGLSLRVDGERQGTPFSVSSAADGHAHLSLASPLTLSADNPHAAISVSLDTSDAFAGVDVGSVSAAANMMTRLAAGFAVTVQ